MNLLQDDIKKLYRHYLIPSLGSAMVTSIYILADAIAIGRGVGSDALAALNITTPVLCLLVCVGLLFGIGGAGLMSYQKGIGNQKESKNYFTITFLFISISSLILWIIYACFMDEILLLTGADEHTFEYAKEYMQIITMFLPIYIFPHFLSAFVRNDKDPNRAMLGVLIGGTTNIVLDYVMVFPLGLGMRGAAIASITGMFVSVAIVSSHFLSKKNELTFIRPFGIGTHGKKIILAGISTFINEFANGLLVCLFNIQILRYGGNSALAVYSVIANCAIFFSSLFCGVGQAVQPLLSENFGGAQYDRIHKLKRMGIRTILILGIVFMSLGFLFPKAVVSVFVAPTDEILTLAGPALKIYFPSFLFMGINLLTVYYLQSVLREQKALLLSLLRSIVISCFLIFVLPMMFGLSGLWFIMLITEAITAAFALKYLKENLSIS